MNQSLRVAVLALGGPAGPASASAAPPSVVELRWDAPAGCPAEAEVIAELEALLGGPLAQRRGEPLTAIARVRQEPGGTWDLRLWTVGEAGTLQRSPTVGAVCKLGRIPSKARICPIGACIDAAEHCPSHDKCVAFPGETVGVCSSGGVGELRSTGADCISGQRFGAGSRFPGACM